MSDQIIHGFLLSRQWRDFSAGIEISLWAWTENGPLRLTIPAQNAVCFVDREQPLALPAGVRRQSVNLPFAIQESSLQDVCNAFVKAIHSEKFLDAA